MSKKVKKLKQEVMELTTEIFKLKTKLSRLEQERIEAYNAIQTVIMSLEDGRGQ